jgi:rhamnosyltransferase
MNRKIAIGVVTYRPNISLMLRLQSAIEMGFSVYLFDNSPEDELIRNFCRKYNIDIVRYITCGKNVGLGFGISSVCAQAYYDSYPALIFFDQDTVFNCSTLAFIEEFYVNNTNIALNYSAIVFNAKHYYNVDVGSRFTFKDVLMAISSGSLFFLENLKKLNWHNESYFVDCVDYEFCLNSNNNNFKIGECSLAPGFDHESEQPDVKYVIFGTERRLRKYSIKRIINTVSASTRLLFTSIISMNIAFSIAIIRSLAIYLNWQLVIRLITNFKLKQGR